MQISLRMEHIKNEWSNFLVKVPNFEINSIWNQDERTNVKKLLLLKSDFQQSRRKKLIPRNFYEFFGDQDDI